MLAGLSANTIASRQRVLNDATRRMVNISVGNRIGVVVRSLHWLPIVNWILFTQCLLMHAVNNGASPAYFADIASWLPQVPFCHHKQERDTS